MITVVSMVDIQLVLDLTQQDLDVSIFFLHFLICACLRCCCFIERENWRNFRISFINFDQSRYRKVQPFSCDFASPRIIIRFYKLSDLRIRYESALAKLRTFQKAWLQLFQKSAVLSKLQCLLIECFDRDDALPYMSENLFRCDELITVSLVFKFARNEPWQLLKCLLSRGEGQFDPCQVVEPLVHTFTCICDYLFGLFSSDLLTKVPFTEKVAQQLIC